MTAANAAYRLDVILAAVVLWAGAAAAGYAAPAAQSAKTLQFEVSTIKPTPTSVDSWNLNPTGDGYSGNNITLRDLIKEAYGVYDESLVTGGPDWIDKDKFDLKAKFDAAEVKDWQALSYRQHADMLRPLLTERFRLKAHFETRTLPVLALVTIKGGPKFQPATPEESHPLAFGLRCLHTASGRMEGCTLHNLADSLRETTHRTVVDKTGIDGIYTFHLIWDSAPNATADERASAPTLFTALQEQLGLKLERSTAPLQVLVIDSAEKPEQN